MTEQPESAVEVLKPCPICGGAPRRNGRNRAGGVLCNGTGVGIGKLHRVQTYGADQAEADAAWNTRATQPAEAQGAGEVERQALASAVGYAGAVLNAHADKLPVPAHARNLASRCQEASLVLAAPQAPAGGRAETVPLYTAEEAWEELVNKSDRTSPEEYPDMCLITRDELRAYMELRQYAPTPQRADAEDVERVREDAKTIQRRANVLLSENAEVLTVTVAEHVTAIRDSAQRIAAALAAGPTPQCANMDRIALAKALCAVPSGPEYFLRQADAALAAMPRASQQAGREAVERAVTAMKRESIRIDSDATIDGITDEEWASLARAGLLGVCRGPAALQPAQEKN